MHGSCPLLNENYQELFCQCTNSTGKNYFRKLQEILPNASRSHKENGHQDHETRELSK